MESSVIVCRWPSEGARLQAVTLDDVMAKLGRGTPSGKTLDMNVQRLSSVIPGDWRQLLKNVCPAQPASKVLSAKVLPALAARLRRQCGARLSLIP